MKWKIFLFPFGLCLLLMATSCKKDSFNTSADARLTISADTLHFDTVFTTTGSVTKSFKIINKNNQKLRLTKLKLMGGNASAYKINVDGIAAAEINNLEIAANDSIYVFVAVTINPNLNNLAFIVKDSIQVNYNGNSRLVQLEAFGQNANFLRDRKLTGNSVWTNNLPYVILGSLLIDTTASLTIQQGCRIYSHADAPFIVDGTLIVNGTKTDSVTFTGDRLDPDYKDLPASWPGIYFRGSSKNNLLKFAVIKNAYQAIVVEKPSINANPKLVLSQSIIDNAYDAGLLGVNSSVNADNCLISNCGNNIAFTYGGTYNIIHCTAASFSNLYTNHSTPVLQLNNYAFQGGTVVTAGLNAVFRNCIFWGDPGLVENEVVVSKQGTGSFSVSIANSLYRAIADPVNGTVLTNCIKNIYPAFDSININRKIFNLRTGSSAAPGINKGAVNIPVLLKDLDDKNRNNGLPDMGCYEKQ